MPVRKVQIGQVWKKSGTEETYLVTKLYQEGLGTIAVLRRTGAESEARVRVKIERSGETQLLAGFTYAQDSEEF